MTKKENESRKIREGKEQKISAKGYKDDRNNKGIK